MINDYGINSSFFEIKKSSLVLHMLQDCLTVMAELSGKIMVDSLLIPSEVLAVWYRQLTTSALIVRNSGTFPYCYQSLYHKTDL